MDSNFFKDMPLAYDIGAYDGGVSQLLLNLGVKKIIAIEPNPYSLQKLKARFDNNEKVVIENILLSESPGTRSFFISRNHPTICTTSSHFKNASRFTNNSDENNVAYTWNEEIKIDACTLNDLYQKHGIPDFIKIDAEGHELEIIKGSTLILKKPLITFEVTEELINNTYESCHILSNRGYNEFGLIMGDKIDEFPKKWHSHDQFMERCAKAFPSETKDFFGMCFARYT